MKSESNTKKMILYFLLFVILLNIAEGIPLPPTLPYFLEYEIYTFDQPSKNVSVSFTNLENNQTVQGFCQENVCIANMADIEADDYDSIEVEACIQNGHFCSTDGINLVKKGASTKIKFSVNPCVVNYDVHFQFITLRGNEHTLISESPDLTDLREDDLLQLKRINIINRGECDLNDWAILFNIVSPSKPRDNPFGMTQILIPPLKKDQVYSLSLGEKEDIEFGGYVFKSYNYLGYVGGEYLNNITIRGTQELTEVGTWFVEGWLTRKYPTEGFEEGDRGISILFKENNYLVEPKFKVTPKSEQITREETKSIRELTAVLLLLTFIMVISAIKEIIDWLRELEIKIRSKNELYYDDLMHLIVAVIISFMFLQKTLEWIVWALIFLLSYLIFYFLLLPPKMKKKIIFKKTNPFKLRQY